MDSIPEISRAPFLQSLASFVEQARGEQTHLGLMLIDLVNLSIDDFGTGYSSLSYFKHIPANELKIDRSFVGSMMEDKQDLELVKIMINIAHQFGLKVVAEGIDDAATLDTLREFGCDYGQGYYLSRPLPRQDFESWMRYWPGLPDR